MLLNSRFCDCQNSFCMLEVKLTPEVANEVDENGYLIIVDRCPNRIPDGTTLVREENGFKIYKFIN
jgi:hypothetical protein